MIWSATICSMSLPTNARLKIGLKLFLIVKSSMAFYVVIKEELFGVPLEMYPIAVMYLLGLLKLVIVPV